MVLQGDTNAGVGAMKGFLIEPLSPADNGAFLAQAIAQAQHEVRLEVYLLTHSEIVNALIQLAATPDASTGKNKRVCVILEPRAYHSASTTNGGPQMHSYDSISQQLSAAGVEVRQNQTHLSYSLGHGWPFAGETHVKLMIVDGQIAYIMTANLTTDALGYEQWGKPRPASNREYIVIDDNPEHVNILMALFNADWDATAPRFDASLLQNSPLVISPSYQGRGNAHNQLLQLLAGAQHSIQIEMEEIHEADHSRSVIEQALIDAVARQVPVQLLLPAQAPTGRGLMTTQDDLDFLAKGGVQIRFSTSLSMHAKLILVDAQLNEQGQVVSGQAFVGSQNLTAAALEYNREVGILLSDPGILASIGQAFSYDWTNAQA